MYIHLGGDISIRSDEIVGVFDIEKASTSKITKEFLGDNKSREVIYVTYDLPKSFVVTKDKLYIAQVSSSTICKRMNFISQ